MKLLGKFSLVAIALLLIINLATPPVKADELDDQLRQKQEEIKQVEAQLDQTKKQEQTLKSQLDIIDQQNTLTQLKIEETNFQITKLDKEIKELETRMTRISQSVDNLSEVLLNRIVATYKHSYVSDLDYVFAADGFSSAIERLKYVKVAQAYDKQKLYELQATKALYTDQKQDKKTRQTQQEKLKKDLEKYQQDLADQKKAKEDLLAVTKNDEAKFQALLVRLRQDSESIARALAGRGVKLGDVKKGERIASVGNSGCSTGPHLHFEVMSPAKVENGQIVGAENKTDPKPYIDSGQFTKPNASYTGGDCSQGGTCHIGDITTRFHQWYNVLGGSYHTGLDIADYYGASIYAAQDGVSYAFSDSRACSLTGTVGKGIAVDHQNGIVTLYWHIP